MGPVPGRYLAGNADFVALPTGEKLPSRNLTNDATGLKNRTDAEIKNMFRNGIRPNGQFQDGPCVGGSERGCVGFSGHPSTSTESFASLASFDR